MNIFRDREIRREIDFTFAPHKLVNGGIDGENASRSGVEFTVWGISQTPSVTAKTQLPTQFAAMLARSVDHLRAGAS